jgi:hypothetical protein
MQEESQEGGRKRPGHLVAQEVAALATAQVTQHTPLGRGCLEDASVHGDVPYV